MFSLLRLYIVEEAVLSCYRHSSLWLYVMILVLGGYENIPCVNDFRAVEINYMIIVPCMFRDV